MKNIIYIFSIFLLFSCTKESDNSHDNPSLYYYSNGQKQDLDPLLLPNYLIIGFFEQAKDNEIISYINNQKNLFFPVTESDIGNFSNAGYSSLIVPLKGTRTYKQLQELIEQAEKDSIVAFANATFTSDMWFSGKNANVKAFTDNFYVAVKNNNDLSDLHAVISQTHTSLVDSITSTHNVYIVSANKFSKGNSCEMANYFYETGKFLWAEPNWLHKFSRK